jgi:hypothetical protein
LAFAKKTRRGLSISPYGACLSGRAPCVSFPLNNLMPTANISIVAQMLKGYIDQSSMLIMIFQSRVYVSYDRFSEWNPSLSAIFRNR